MKTFSLYLFCFLFFIISSQNLRTLSQNETSSYPNSSKFRACIAKQQTLPSVIIDTLKQLSTIYVGKKYAFILSFSLSNKCSF